MRPPVRAVTVVTPNERAESKRREVSCLAPLEHTGHTSPLSKHLLMSLSRWFGAAFAVVSLTRPALGQAKVDSVSLRFAWPVGMTARVDQEWTRMQIGPARNEKAIEIQAAAGPNEPAGRTRRVDIRTARYTYIK
jgi:hypothetical protein